MTISSNEFDVRETYAAQEAALAKIWDDPELDVYNDYGAQSSSRTAAGISDRTVGSLPSTPSTATTNPEGGSGHP